MTELRPYQLEVLEQIEQAIAAGQRRILVTLPTGAGKTVCAADIIRRFNERGLFSLFLAHRREIIGQTSQRLTEHARPQRAHQDHGAAGGRPGGVRRSASRARAHA